MIKAAGAILLVLFGIWAGARVYSSRSARQTAAVKTAVGEASPPIPSDFEAPFDPAAPSGVKIPERLPDFSLADRNGKLTPISRWAGKSLILNFWATWCAPCRREIPLLKSLNAQWSAHGVAVVGVAVDDREKVVAYADEFKIPYALLVGEQDALDVVTQLGVDTPVFPFTVFTDKRGQVVTLYLGELHRRQADLILTEVDKLNQERLELAEAQRNIAAGLHALAPDRSG
jgi:thiol-disulfide isomerase/thioredoxin